MRFAGLILIAVCLICMPTALADTLKVSPDTLTLTQALSQCREGDIIELAEGVYAEPEEQFPLTVTKKVTIRAAENAKPIIDAPTYQAAFRIEADGVALQGLEIRMRRTGLYAIGDDMLVESCRIVLADTNWRTSSCGIWFGGIYRAKLMHCAFEGCSIAMAGPPLSERSKHLPVLTGLFEVGEDREYFTSHRIEDCTVNGRPLFYAVSQAQVTAPADAGQIICVGCGSATVADADVSDGSMGMILAYNDQVCIERCRADRCGVFGIYIAKCGGGVLRDSVTEETNHGMDIRASEHIRLERCTALNCDQGLFFAQVRESVMDACLVKNTGQGYFTAGGHNNTFMNCTVIGCENGMNLQKESDALVTGCTVENCSVCGVRLDWTPTVFVHNMLRGNWVGVMAYGDVNFSLMDNTFENHGGCALYLRDILYSRIGGNVFTGDAHHSVEAHGTMSGSLWQSNQLDVPAQLDATASLMGME